jgi:uncharacterized protein
MTLDFGGAWDGAALDALHGSLQRLADWYVAATSQGRRFYLSCFDERIRTHTQGPVAASERCQIGTRQFSIAPSGRLYPCVQFVHEDRDGGFAIGDVWSGFDASRQAALGAGAESDKPECGGCALMSRCSSWCACVNFQSTGRIDRPSPVLCEYERMLIPIADRIGKRLVRSRNSLFLHKHYNPAYPVLSHLEIVAGDAEGERR